MSENVIHRGGTLGAPVAGQLATPKAMPKTQKQPPAMTKRYRVEVSCIYRKVHLKTLIGTSTGYMLNYIIITNLSNVV
jgi:hypothetical protein